MCLVEIEGQPKLQPACRTPVEEGMVVYSNSPKALKAQRAQLEFLLLNHPIDCPICDQAGECGLQDFYMMEFGGHKSRFAREEKLRRPKAVDIGPHIVFDAERCILCTRCIRFCMEIAKQPDLGIRNRGNHSQITPFPGKRIDNPYSVNTVDICPVGALTSKDFRFKIRPWFLYSTPSICPGCANGCNIFICINKQHYVNLQRQQVYRIKPRENTDVNDCWLCDEGRLSYKSVNENRVLQPYIRQAGELVPVSWEQAITEAKDRLTKVLEEYGPERIGALASSKCTNEANYLFKKFVREILKTPNLDFLKGLTGNGDDFLIKEDKTPNSRGVMDLEIRPGPQGMSAAEMLNITTSLKALYLMGGEPTEIFASEWVKEALVTMELVILQTSNFTETCQWAHIILPSATFAEVDGTFTNDKGRVQRLFKAMDPRGVSQPHETIITRLAQAMGHEWPELTPAEIMGQIASEISKYQGLGYGLIGDKGILIGEERPNSEG
jgi:NADH-quinone oxidoreductase subunit G